MPESLLPLLAAGAIIAFVAVYLTREGPALGVGVLLPRLAARTERDRALAAWMGSQATNFLWLVCAAGTMYGAFPFAFSALAQALLIPIVLMLAAHLIRSLAAAARMRASDSAEPGLTYSCCHR